MSLSGNEYWSHPARQSVSFYPDVEATVVQDLTKATITNAMYYFEYSGNVVAINV